MEMQYKELFAIVCIKTGSTNNSMYKNLKPDTYYFLNDWYRYDNDTDSIIKTNDCKSKHFYGDNVTVSAIVGKNGSGKSALLELIYRTAFCLGCFVHMNRDAVRQHIYTIENFYVDVFFARGERLGCLSVKGISFEAYWVDNGDKIDCEELYNNAFYTLAINYSPQSLFSYDYKDESLFNDLFFDRVDDTWIEEVYKFHNTGILPITILPNKSQGRQIYDNMVIEYNLEMAALLLYFQENDYQLLPGYNHVDVLFLLNEDFLQKKIAELPSDIEFPNTPINEWPDNCFGSILIKTLIPQAQSNEILMRYVLVETLLMVHNNHRYEDICFLYGNHKILDTVEKYSDGSMDKVKMFSKEYIDIMNFAISIKRINTPDTLFLRQAERFSDIINRKVKLNLIDFTWNSYRDYLDEDQYNGSFENILENFPPRLYTPKILFEKMGHKEKNYFHELSSGEKQYIFNAVSYLVPLIKLSNNLNKESVGLYKNDHYKNICLIFDEIEQSYHPEFQQNMIADLLHQLRKSKLLDHFNFHIILSTHSPFILSDIPSSNILFLKDGEPQPSFDKKTLGANVYDLLKDGFFMDNSMGGYVQHTIEEIIDIYHLLMENRNESTQNAITLYNNRKDTYQYLAENICDSYLKRTLSGIMNIISKKIGNA